MLNKLLKGAKYRRQNKTYNTDSVLDLMTYVSFWLNKSTLDYNTY